LRRGSSENFTVANAFQIDYYHQLPTREAIRHVPPLRGYYHPALRTPFRHSCLLFPTHRGTLFDNICSTTDTLKPSLAKTGRFQRWVSEPVSRVSSAHVPAFTPGFHLPRPEIPPGSRPVRLIFVISHLYKCYSHCSIATETHQ